MRLWLFAAVEVLEVPELQAGTISEPRITTAVGPSLSQLQQVFFTGCAGHQNQLWFRHSHALIRAGLTTYEKKANPFQYLIAPTSASDTISPVMS